MNDCDFCYKEFENLEEFIEGAEFFKLCKSCLENFKKETRFDGREDNYAP